MLYFSLNLDCYLFSNYKCMITLTMLLHSFQDDETPASLLKLAAILLKNELVQLDTLYPHVSTNLPMQFRK